MLRSIIQGSWYGSFLHSVLEFSTRFYGLFYWKNEVSVETTFIFILWCGTVSRENWMKLAVLFYCFYWLKKWNLLWFHGWDWLKLKKETDRARLRRARSVSFFPNRILVGFTILASFTHETTASFIFEPKKQKTKQPVSSSFTWNWPHTKKNEVSVLPKTTWCLGWDRGPKRRPERRSSGPAGWPRSLINFFVCIHETTQGFNFGSQKFSWNPWNH